MAEEKPKGSASESEEEFIFDPKEIGRRLVTPLDELGFAEGEIEQRLDELKKRTEQAKETTEEVKQELLNQIKETEEQKAQGDQTND